MRIYAGKYSLKGWTLEGQVLVIYDECGEEQEHELHVKLTSEGLILDLVDEEGEVVATAGYTVSELEELCH